MTFAPTPEQEVIRTKFQDGKSMKVRAIAGSGKTSTLTLCANATSDQKVYIAFNKAIATQASTIFPSNTTCKTGHALGFKPMVKEYGRPGKMTDSLRARDIVSLLSIKSLTQVSAGEFMADSTVGYIIGETVKRFTQSSAEVLGPEHVFAYPKMELMNREDLESFNAKILKAATSVWGEMINPLSKVPLGFDGYLKKWALSCPVIDQPVIMVDEAQDLNGAMFSILQQQMGQIVYVGDPHQQIYSWRGAVNAMEKIDYPEYLLSKSFRFGQVIADLASNILGTIDHKAPKIEGHVTDSKLVNHMGEPCTYLFRKNSSMLEYITAASDLKNVFVQGGVKDIVIILESLEKLDAGRSVSHPELLGFSDLEEVRSYAEKSHNNGLKRMIKVYDENDMKVLLKMLDTIATVERPGQTVLCTAHKSKGCEWDNVVLYNDFNEQPSESSASGVIYDKEETRLIYVAATRTKLNLELPEWMREQYCKDLTVGEYVAPAPKLMASTLEDVPF